MIRDQKWIKRKKSLRSLLNSLLTKITTIVTTLDFLKNGFHFLGLFFPFFLSHLRLTLEELFIWLAIAASKSVPQGCVLSVIVVEVQMVHGVARSAVDDGAICDIFTVVNHDCPEIDKDKQYNVGPLLEREDERKYVVRNTLSPTIHGMEGVRCIRRRHDPFVVRLVQSFVDQRMVKTSMNPIDTEVGKEEEKRELQNTIVGEGLLGESVVHFAVSSYFS